MIIKLLGLGLKGYVRDKFNLFDCVIVVISTVEIVLKLASIDGLSSGGAISAFRGIRLLRVFKLARSWKSFQMMLIKIGKSLKDISNFSVLLFLFMFTYALLGMELFAHRVAFAADGHVQSEDSGGTAPRANFDSFLEGITTIYIVLIGEVSNSEHNFSGLEPGDVRLRARYEWRSGALLRIARHLWQLDSPEPVPRNPAQQLPGGRPRR